MLSMNQMQNKLIEFTYVSKETYENPFWDTQITAVFCNQEQKICQTVYGFYDGMDQEHNQVWKIRWMPLKAGHWTCQITTRPETDDLCQKTEFQIKKDQVLCRGYLKTDMSKNWKFHFDQGEPFFLFGDTMYNLIGAHYCGVDIRRILETRRQQGINYLRVRIHNSSYHPPIKSSWMNRDCWPWGGSAQWPDFKRFHLEYFQSMDEVMLLATELDMGLEMIFEAWMLEFPFNDRGRFLPEYEALWLQYIIARYSAFPCVYLWCPANEYEFYPDGTASYHTEADRWMKRVAAQIKSLDPFGHPIGIHNWGEETTPLTNRCQGMDDLDVYLVQTAWAKDMSLPEKELELCASMDQHISQLVPIQDRAVIVSEFGYERAAGLETVDAHDKLNCHHTRRGQWRAGFMGYPIVHGFNNTWGPHMTVSSDATGTGFLIHYYRFMTEEIKFYEMVPDHEIILRYTTTEKTAKPLCLFKSDGSVIAIYFPVKGECELKLETAEQYTYCWYQPQNGLKSEADCCSSNQFATPGTNDRDDWVLLICRRQVERGFLRKD